MLTRCRWNQITQTLGRPILYHYESCRALAASHGGYATTLVNIDRGIGSNCDDDDYSCHYGRQACRRNCSPSGRHHVPIPTWSYMRYRVVLVDFQLFKDELVTVTFPLLVQILLYNLNCFLMRTEYAEN